MSKERVSRPGSFISRHLTTFALCSVGLLLPSPGWSQSVTAMSAAKAPAKTPGAWEVTGSMATARQYHTATLLPNGQVLAAGGFFFVSYASAELYDPATGLWTETGSMANARGFFTATLLPNGQVLVAGGEGNTSGTSSTAELYDPATGLWTETGSMATGRFNHTATLLPNGQVLVAGGLNDFSRASAELYDPATGTWTGTGSMAHARWNHAATLLPNGQVLVVGGYDFGDILASAELYDPATGTWTETGSMADERYNLTVTLLPTGQVLVAGGISNVAGALTALTSAELYDPATGLWTETGSMATGRFSHTATLLPNGQVLVAAGGGNTDVLASAELYGPASGTWTETGDLVTARFLHTATLLSNGKVLAAGGQTCCDSLASAELYTNRGGGELTLVSAASLKGGFAIDLPLTGPSGVEDRSGGPEKEYTVVMTFNQNIVSVGSASSTCGDVQSIVIDSSDPHKVSIKLVNVAHNCNGSSITVSADSIADDQGNVLDSASVGLGLLLGDVNGDRVVDRDDLTLAQQFTHQKANATNFRADVANDDFIYSADKRLIEQQRGTSLP